MVIRRALVDHISARVGMAETSLFHAFEYELRALLEMFLGSTHTMAIPLSYRANSGGDSRPSL